MTVMKNTILPTICVCSLLFATSFVLADDVKLKSGKVIKDVNLIKKTKRFYKFRQLNGQEMKLSVDSVAEVIEKPTLWDEFKKRKKALKPKDAKGFFELAVWAKEKGLKKDWRPVMKQVLKIDKKHEGANKAMGRVLHDGKWISKKEADRARQKAMEADYKARGWKRKGGKYVSPAEYSKSKGGWTLHEGHWVDKKEYENIKSKKLTWYEGRWVGPKTLARMKNGERKLEGRWLPIEDLNEMHASWDNPWKIKLDSVGIVSICKHPTVLSAAKIAAETYKELIHVYGEEADIYGKKGPLFIFLASDGQEYNKFAQGTPQTEWEAANGNNFGAWYSTSRGGGVAFYHSPEYLRFWVSYATALAYGARLTNEAQIGTNLMVALASYGCAFHEGKFAPNDWYFRKYFQNTSWLDDAKQRPSSIISGVIFTGGNAENPVARAGLIMHYLQQKNPEAFAKGVSRFLAGSGTEDSLIDACLGKQNREKFDGDFENFAKRFSASYKPWKP
jgi:hypothetical protein